MSIKIAYRDGVFYDNGWYIAREEDSHRILKHPAKSGIVVVAAHPSKDLHRAK
jgi:predicted RNA binding protein YcfA (HicA-like mRNA interferase family)